MNFDKWSHQLAADMSKVVEAEDTLQSKPGDTSDIGQDGPTKHKAYNADSFKITWGGQEFKGCADDSFTITSEEYRAKLCNMPEEDRNRWLQGEWAISDELKPVFRPTLEGMVSEVEAVRGVRSVKYLLNDSNEPTTFLPGRSICLWVVGGDREQIARAIWNTKAAGYVTVGNTSIVFDDYYGHTPQIDFFYSED